MQGRPAVLALKRNPSDEHDAYLAFSFEVDRTTAVLSIEGTHFQPVVLPGLDAEDATVLLTSVHGGWLVQATQQVRPPL